MKGCQSSCKIYDELLIKTVPQFKIGRLDGPSFIMTILFALFVSGFIALLRKFKLLQSQNSKTKSNCAKDERRASSFTSSSSSSSSSFILLSFVNRILTCFCNYTKPIEERQRKHENSTVADKKKVASSYISF